MKEVDELFALVKLLRKKCPWDQKQTFESSLRHLLEEGDEIRQALEKEDWENLAEEIGDTFFNLLFLVNLLEEKKGFRLENIVRQVHDKMVGRHPHVFEGIEALTPEEAYRAFYEAKEKEKKRKTEKVLYSGSGNDLFISIENSNFLRPLELMQDRLEHQGPVEKSAFGNVRGRVFLRFGKNLADGVQLQVFSRIFFNFPEGDHIDIVVIGLFAFFGDPVNSFSVVFEFFNEFSFEEGLNPRIE
jgi:ATP diphosphatase